MTTFVRFDYTALSIRTTRPTSWFKAARKEFETFSLEAQSICLAALTFAAEGGKSDIAKPLHGLGSGVLDITMAHRKDAFRVMYATQVGADLWVLHAFQKKSTRGVKTPKHEMALVRERLKRLKEILP